MDGNFGNYRTEIVLNGGITAQCDCPYPGNGCKHVVAILLEIFDEQCSAHEDDGVKGGEPQKGHYLTPEEIKSLALADRTKRGRTEEFNLTAGDMIKGDHLVTTKRGKQYQVTLHDPAEGHGHCSCPDYLTNKLGICKHLVFASDYLQKRKDFSKVIPKQHFPYIDIYWDTITGKPRLFHDPEGCKIETELKAILSELFNRKHFFCKDSILDFIPYLHRLEQFKQVRIQEPVIHKLATSALDDELGKVSAAHGNITFSDHLNISPYPYQIEGITFGLFKKATLIGDEMGLGKTLQAIGLGVLKKDIFGFKNILVVTMSSLKQQWKREIERFSKEQACVIAGSANQRKKQYRDDTSLFKITNYEAVLRDVTIISRLKPDLIILDEAQRIKNFET